ncbi:MAG TPA: hypothetical protein VM305_03125 [Candidatus Limnocylindrales bacterium]|nr:hypothetical protein [Candidatus Limnocylindrales bacterium]
MDTHADRPGNIAASGTALVSAGGDYLDADPVLLDLYGVTLDVVRAKRIGDFSPPQYAELERLLWSLWTFSGNEHAEGSGTVVRPDGATVEVSVALDRLSDGNVRVSITPVDEPVKAAPSLRIQTVLGHWRELERHLADLPPDDPARHDLEARIDALREEYQRRVREG